MAEFVEIACKEVLDKEFIGIFSLLVQDLLASKIAP